MLSHGVLVGRCLIMAFIILLLGGGIGEFHEKNNLEVSI